jgi:hypothetical protein
VNDNGHDNGHSNGSEPRVILSAAVPVDFCRTRCAAFRGDRCLATTRGPGVCLWPAEVVEIAIKQGVGRKKK